MSVSGSGRHEAWPNVVQASARNETWYQFSATVRKRRPKITKGAQRCEALENMAKHTELKSTEIPRENVPKMATVVYK